MSQTQIQDQIQILDLVEQKLKEMEQLTNQLISEVQYRAIVEHDIISDLLLDKVNEIGFAIWKAKNMIFSFREYIDRNRDKAISHLAKAITCIDQIATESHNLSWTLYAHRNEIVVPQNFMDTVNEIKHKSRFIENILRDIEKQLIGE